jgi:chorismate mutase
MDIEELRKKIDKLDERLVELLNERANCAQQIGKIKRGLQMPIYEPRREESVFANVRRSNRGPLPDGELIQVYERIIDVMRKIQREEISPEELLNGDSGTEEND